MIGIRLKELRRGKNVTLREMSEKTGLSSSTISNFERGCRKPSNKSLLILADYYGVSAEYIYPFVITKRK